MKQQSIWWPTYWRSSTNWRMSRSLFYIYIYIYIYSRT